MGAAAVASVLVAVARVQVAVRLTEWGESKQSEVKAKRLQQAEQQEQALQARPSPLSSDSAQFPSI